MVHQNVRIHPTAIVEDDVSIGAGASVWDKVHIRTGAVIGKQCIILETAVASRYRHPVCPIREIRDGGAIVLQVFRKQNIFI